jgi:hypothetical protein
MKIYSVLSILYVCETWFITLREEQKLWVFEYEVLERICGPTKEVARWAELHNEELHNLYQIFLGPSNQGARDGQDM